MSGTGYILWGGGASRSMLVELVLIEAGQPYELREIDFHGGENREPAFLAVNPLGWVPALTTPGGETLVETPAINTWLCEEHGLDLVPPRGDPLRGRYLGCYHSVIGEIEPTLKRVFFAHRYVLEPEQTEAMRKHAWGMLLDRIAPTEQMIEGPFFLGDRFTLADLTLAYWMTYADRAGALGDFPKVAAIVAAAKGRPGLAPVFERLDASITAYYRKVRGG